MKKRMLIIGGVVLFLIAVAVPLPWWRKRIFAERIETAEHLLTDPDPMRRIEAARLILDLDPARDDVRIGLAEAMLETAQHAPVREVLRPINDPISLHFLPAQILRGGACLSEAKAIVRRVTFSNLDLNSDQLDRLPWRADAIVATKERGDGE